VSSLTNTAGLGDRTYVVNSFHRRKYIFGCFVKFLYMFCTGDNSDPLKEVRNLEHSTWPLNFDVRCAPYCLEIVKYLFNALVYHISGICKKLKGSKIREKWQVRCQRRNMFKLYFVTNEPQAAVPKKICTLRV
jgi:hypothetical protein